MKIKLHNSLAKINKKNSLFLFDEKLFVRISSTYSLWIPYDMFDRSYFLYFYPETKKIEEGFGFGKNDKESDPYWWKKWEWEEVNE